MRLKRLYLYNYIEYQEKQTYCQSFKIQEEDRPVILKLLIYAIRDKTNALKLGLDVNKGIYYQVLLLVVKLQLCISLNR